MVGKISISLMKMMAIGSCLALISCGAARIPLSNEERRNISGASGQAELFEKLLESPYTGKIDSILIYKDKKLVFERYWNGYHRDKHHDIRSSTKAITALLVGIAIDEGFIAGANEPILSFYPERRELQPEFASITIEHLLTMRSGLDSNDWDRGSPGNEEIMYTKYSWVDFFFSLEVVNKPGEQFSYSTAGVVLLGDLIARASAMPFDQFAERYLFEKLGITDYSYDRTPAGEIDSGGHLKIKPEDFAKIGLLVLQNGMWEGKRVVSEKWIEKINQPAVAMPHASETGPYMGYLWWQEPVVEGEVRSFQSRGNGGQYLIAVPTLDLLGVFTGSAYNSNKQFRPFILMKEYIIPSFKQGRE